MPVPRGTKLDPIIIEKCAAGHRGKKYIKHKLHNDISKMGRIRMRAAQRRPKHFSDETKERIRENGRRQMALLHANSAIMKLALERAAAARRTEEQRKITSEQMKSRWRHPEKTKGTRAGASKRMKRMNADPNFPRGTAKKYIINSEKTGQISVRGSLELEFAQMLIGFAHVTTVSYEKFTVPYVFNGKSCRYIPDFYYEYQDGRQFCSEVKSIGIHKLHKECDLVRWSVAEKYFQELGIEFRVYYKKKKSSKLFEPLEYKRVSL